MSGPEELKGWGFGVFISNRPATTCAGKSDPWLETTRPKPGFKLCCFPLFKKEHRQELI